MKTNQSQKNNINEWKKIPVGEVFSFIKTHAISRDNLSNGMVSDIDVGNIHYGDIHSTYTSTKIDLSKIKIPLIKDKNFKPKKEELLKNGDIVMADASEDYEGIGVAVSVHGIGNNKVVGGLHTFVLRDNKALTNEYYRQYIFRNPILRNKLQKNANGVSVYGISKTTVLELLLLLPSLSEQNRIVSVLETWDKEIENLNKKIEIKKQIKKGLMQDLLSGKKRLIGFKNKWGIYTLGEICNLYQPKTITSTEVKDSGKYKVYGANGIIGFYDKYNHEDREVIITCRGSTCGTINYTEPKSWITGNAMVATPKNNKIIKDYLFYILSFMNLKSVITGMAQPQITGKDLSPFKLKLPDIDEQELISNILITADKEITKLEKKLQITKEQKKYLLNNLITGTIRTPEKLSTNSIK